MASLIRVDSNQSPQSRSARWLLVFHGCLICRNKKGKSRPKESSGSFIIRTSECVFCQISVDAARTRSSRRKRRQSANIQIPPLECGETFHSGRIKTQGPLTVAALQRRSRCFLGSGRRMALVCRPFPCRQSRQIV